MKFNHKLIAVCTAFGLMLSGCERSFEELEKDPNRAVTAPASLVLQGIEFDMYDNIGRPFSSEMRWNQFYAINYNYYGNNEYTWSTFTDHYTTLKNVVKMEEEAKRAGLADVNVYSALGKFFRAFFIDQMSVRGGDLPASEALKGLEVLTPKYDSQKEVYMQILTWLDQSNAEMSSLIAAGNTKVTGDFYLGEDLVKWQKVVNSFRLRILLRLSKKENEAGMNVKSQFAEIIANPTKYPLLSGMADNLEFKSNVYNKYPSNPDNFGFDATRQNMAQTYVGLLTARKDPRVMVTTEPAGAQLKAGKKPSDFTAFIAASSGEDLSDMSNKAGKNNGAGFAPGEYSFQSRSRYYSNYVGESTFLVGYPEMCFNIAEGIARGWATGSAESWYKKGIQASQEFYGVKTGTLTMTYSKTGGRASTDFANYTVDFNFDQYYAQPLVKYAGNNIGGIEQIVTQKYLAFFMNSGMEAYFNYIRTGFPKFMTGVGTGNSGRIAVRWQYPLSERTTNAANYNAAIQSQFAGKDDINQPLWLAK
ncbi:SusD/RagB family nutrient-binding outer membrane lipoprotein [Dyadobacter chenwenxiniae]|uniref:SusD/RagB family nutrient-binding outer membrane lipoprotein n=1 Tax=Dyadobacter chenwenxiniae TaxID=2906456 RepID=A0A9X1PQG9_9BACT|nr:SusD/RagB family nutrient-binding outer membrane lipoprotein [Dyadobacter chenwenxiniae]MCF0063006.1 SusD/RagB family nutrient-binding outer membrane lipoprotein [Dyadobacter chenwenxiniae]UON84821.1 SusD/RagB family nutrient-binding outer membrane lipoprotein [Dyadobacter chenwenxiniae]